MVEFETRSSVPFSDERRLEQLRRLTEISRALTYTTSLEQVLRLAVDRAAEMLDASKALLMLTDADGLLHVRAARGIDEERVEDFREALDETLMLRLQGLLGEVADDCFIAVPLVAQGQVIGLLAVVRANGQPCVDADEWLLSALADQAAVALENARLAGEVRHEMEARVQALETASEAREKALITLSHDLRSPLNAIDSYAELLEMQIYGTLTDRQREVLGRIRLSGRHLLGVLENVMQMARLSAGVMRMEEKEVALNRVVEEAVKIALPAAEAKEQSVRVEASDAIAIRADPDRLRQVIINIMSNAIKYTPRGGSLQVTVRLSDQGGQSVATVAVSDNGPGIPVEDFERIFQPYERLSATASEPGVGLGLAISRELIRRMGGEIAVHSKPGDGSTFTVILALHRP